MSDKRSSIEEARKRVAKGAAFLDKMTEEETFLKGWREVIDRDRFATYGEDFRLLDTGCGCILAQIDNHRCPRTDGGESIFDFDEGGQYSRLTVYLGLSDLDAVELGFERDEGVFYRHLDQAWIELLEAADAKHSDMSDRERT